MNSQSTGNDSLIANDRHDTESVYSTSNSTEVTPDRESADNLIASSGESDFYKWIP